MSLIRLRFNYDSFHPPPPQPPDFPSPKTKKRKESPALYAWEPSWKAFSFLSLAHTHTHRQKKEKKTTLPPLCFLSAAQ